MTLMNRNLISDAACAHEDFAANVDITRLSDKGAFIAEITAHCARCGEAMRFACEDVGLLPDRPAVSPDGTILSVPMAPISSQRFPSFTGYRIRAEGK